MGSAGSLGKLAGSVGAGGGSTTVDGQPFQIVFTASGPRLQLRTFDGSSWSDSGSPLVPGVELNTDHITAWGTDQVTLTGALQSTLSDGYVAAWDISAYLDLTNPYAFNVAHGLTRPITDYRMATGIFRSSDGQSFNWGGGCGLAEDGGRKALAIRNNGFQSGGFYTLMETTSGTAIMSPAGILIGIHTRDAQASGVDGTRDVESDNVESTTITSSAWLTLVLCGADATVLSDVKISGTLSPWEGW